MMGICISWKNYEVVENIKWKFLMDLASDASRDTSGISAAYRAEEFKVDLYSLTLGFDSSLTPITSLDILYLGRFNSLLFEKEISKLNCPGVKSPQPFNLMQRRRSLRVGYMSYDWRDHPMGRYDNQLYLVKRLILNLLFQG